ncbi:MULTISPECIES: J domain-containing protein [unclassified Coleofasciculus]|uniref:J domain-containing protein n=1 Tax=unclassified Coleofasciculus TaxID=2692782 RepID=UPI001882F6C7|nr:MULTISPECIES: DnaJ domain-containing protein [unclassified Coleofasciculus]MBE9124643.1 DnaJ domain-containing protein [Coleofasciculus sp. LEGE 07081]MBE9147607.1 DnaJ domain-containing protein [Coleofasciculus sp. LEGE 07092]
MQDSRNYYEILEVPPEVTPQDLKKAYRRLARQYHPDLHPENPAAGERFKAICQAYHVLSDPVQRSQYDQGFDSDRNLSEPVGLTAKDIYTQAVSKALNKEYQAAIENCNRAIELNPDFVEAYVERGVSRYKLGNARGALQDCNQALRIDPNYARAYYYQGRARYRLGYTQAAIEAYTQAIAQAPDRARVYYYRGLANKDLKDNEQAVEDLQQAAELFNEQGDRTGYELAKETLRTLNQSWSGLGTSYPIRAIAIVTSVLWNTVQTFQSFALNPPGGLLPAFASLDKQRAVVVGILFAGIFNLCFVCTAYFSWQNLVKVSIIKLVVVGIVPFLTLTVISASTRTITRSSGSIAGDIFLAGAVLMPLSFLVIASSISTTLGIQIMVIITVFVSCYTILTLYSGCTQIANLSETTAAVLVPIMLLVSGWFSYWAFTVM